jgi:hypothetical protein
LVIELGTVKNHVHNILRKLNVNSRRDAVHVSRLAGLWGQAETKIKPAIVPVHAVRPARKAERAIYPQSLGAST